jgi:polar amino acid transport system substrate-binding protein
LRKILCMLAVLMVIAALGAAADSQTASPTAVPAPDDTVELRVAALIVPPFVMEQNGSLTGFNIELWNAIAARLKLRTSYEILPDPITLEQAMRSQRADLSVAPIFITAARNESFDFSVPTLQAGLQIMVRDNGERAHSASPLWELLRLLFSRTSAVWLGMACCWS